MGQERRKGRLFTLSNNNKNQLAVFRVYQGLAWHNLIQMKTPGLLANWNWTKRGSKSTATVMPEETPRATLKQRG